MTEPATDAERAAGRECEPPLGTLSSRRHLGILAHSVEGAALCFTTFCRHGFNRLGPHDHPDVTLDCIPLARSMPSWDSGDLETIRAIMATSTDRLAAAGAEFFICPDNTVHQALEVPGPPLALPGLHIAAVVAQRSARAGHRRIGILGTKYLMDSDVYPRALAAHGILTRIPEEIDRMRINQIIFDELLNGDLRAASRLEFTRIISDLADQGCDAVALVCTEIPLLVGPEDSTLPTLDSTRLLAAAAFEVAIGQAPVPTWRGGPYESS